MDWGGGGLLYWTIISLVFLVLKLVANVCSVGVMIYSHGIRQVYIEEPMFHLSS